MPFKCINRWSTLLSNIRTMTMTGDFYTLIYPSQNQKWVRHRIAKADRRPREKKKFYHQFSIVKYSYLPTDTFRKYVEMHVTRSKLTLKFTGYCRQTSYTDSTVIHTLVPAVAWELQSQFAPGYMHFNTSFWRCLWEDMIISQWKNGDRTFFSLEVGDRLLLLSTLTLYV